jgi:hypothetical protein
VGCAPDLEDSCVGAVITGVECDVGRYVEWVARRPVATMNRGQVREPYKYMPREHYVDPGTGAADTPPLVQIKTRDEPRLAYFG